MFPKKNRITHADFINVSKTGKSIYSGIIRIKYTKNSQDASKFGIVITKKASKNAVNRNYIKRIIRSAVTSSLKSFPYPITAVIYINNVSNPIDKELIKNEVTESWQRIIKILEKT